MRSLMPRSDVEVVLAQRQRCRGAQLGPLVAPEGEVAACRVGHGVGTLRSGDAGVPTKAARRLVHAAGVGRRASSPRSRRELHAARPCSTRRAATAASSQPFADDGRACTGIDIDPAHLVDRTAISLAMDWGDQQFDVVVGNPPFLNQLAAATSRGGRSRFGGGPYADSAAEFLALAIRLTRPGGRVGLVLPLSLLSTRDVAAIRDDGRRAAALRWMWWSPTPMFDANVRRVGRRVGSRRRPGVRCAARSARSSSRGRRSRCRRSGRG